MFHSPHPFTAGVACFTCFELNKNAGGANQTFLVNNSGVNAAREFAVSRYSTSAFSLAHIF
jgi:hypothetical protein